MWRRATNVAWWLGVSVYFGGLLTLVAVVAPTLVRTAADAKITMPGLSSPPLEMHKQVTGQIFGDVLKRFTVVEVAALGLMLVGLIGFLLAHTPVRRSVWVLLAMWVLLAGVVGYDAGMLRPTVWQQRNLVWQTAAAHVTDGMGATWPERTEFLRLHTQSETMGRVKAYLLLAMILVTAWRGLAERPMKHALTRGAAPPQRMREEL